MHDCPDCGSACYCGGDVDDINLPLDPPGGCFHCDPFDDEHDEHDEDDTDLALGARPRREGGQT